MGAIPTDSSLLLSYKMEAGISDQSYGLFVAKMAGIPREILENAERMVQKMREEGREMDKALQQVDVNHLTPIQAMLCLNELKEIAQKRDEEEREQLLESFVVKYGKKLGVCCSLVFKVRYSLGKMALRKVFLVLLISIQGVLAWFSLNCFSGVIAVDIEHMVIAQIAKNYASTLSFVYAMSRDNHVEQGIFYN